MTAWQHPDSHGGPDFVRVGSWVLDHAAIEELAEKERAGVGEQGPQRSVVDPRDSAFRRGERLPQWTREDSNPTAPLQEANASVTPRALASGEGVEPSRALRAHQESAHDSSLAPCRSASRTSERIGPGARRKPRSVLTALDCASARDLLLRGLAVAPDPPGPSRPRADHPRPGRCRFGAVAWPLGHPACAGPRRVWSEDFPQRPRRSPSAVHGLLDRHASERDAWAKS